MKKFMTLFLSCVALSAFGNYVTSDSSTTNKWEFVPNNNPYTFSFQYQVNQSVVMDLTCQPLIERATFLLMVDGKEQKVSKVFGYDSKHDLAQHVEMTMEGFVFSDFAHIFAQYETIWLTDVDGKEIVTFDNQNRMSANELFSFRKQCRFVIPSD